VARSSTGGQGRRLITPGGMPKGRPLQFLQETVSELRKSVWPTREETVRLTWIVIGLSFIVGVLLSSLDYSLGQTFTRFVLR
jgi:preprotein translocase subunit SecE